MTAYKNRIKKIVLILVICTSLFASKTFSQTPVTAGQQYYYTFFSYGSPDWWYIEAENGIVVNQGMSFGVPYAYVVWSCAGPGLVRYVEYHETNGTSSDQKNVSVSCPSISAPNTSFTFTQACRMTTVNRTGNPPPGEEWYWQIEPNGTETSQGSGPSILVFSSNQYFLRPLINGCCWGPAIGTGVIPLISPPFPIASDASRCGPGNINLTASSDSGYGVRWYTNGGSLIPGEPSINQSIDATTTFIVRSYSTSIPSCESGDKYVVATVNALPAAPTSASSNPTSLCGPGSITLSATGAQQGVESYKWYFAGSALPDNTPYINSTATFHAVKRNNATGCEGPQTSVTVQVNPAVSTFVVSGNFCGTGTVSLSGSQTGVNYQLKKNESNEGAPIGGTGLGLSWPNKPDGTYTVVATNTNGTCQTTMSGSSIINPLPGAPTTASSNPSSLCGSGTITLGATGAVGGESYRWYTVASGGTALPNNTPTISSTTTFYAAKRIDATGCEGLRTSVTVQVNPSVSTFVVSGNFCGTGTVSLSGSQTGVNYQLKKNESNEGAPIGGTGLGLSWPNKPDGTYTVVATNTNGTCQTTMSGSSIINPLPGAPTTASSNPSSLCGSGSITLSATGAVGGESYRWYTVASGGTALPNNTPTISSTTTFYAAKRIDATGCEGLRTSVTISVGSTPTTFNVSGSGSYCGSGTVTLSGSQSGVNYQLVKNNSINEGSPILGTGVALSWPGKPTGTYTVIATNANGSCATNMNLSAVITADPLSVGGTVSSSSEQYGIASGTLSLSGQTGSVLRWEKNEGGGWLPITHVLTNYSYTNVAVTTQFRAVVKSGSCAEAFSTAATVTIFANPQITINGPTHLTYGVSTQLSTTTYYSYQWKKSGVDISGATAQTLTVKEPGDYTVTVKGSASASPITSGSATILSTIAHQTAVNMASVTRILKEGVTQSTSLYILQPEEVMQSITYFDGLGRPFQSVSVGASPSRGDIIQPQGFSKNGLPDSTFLPYASILGDGRLRLNAIRNLNSYLASEQYLFYQNTSKVASDAYPFARTVYRNTPDAKVVEQGAPGADSQPGSTHTTRNVIAFNDATYRIRYWKIDGTTNSNHPNNSIMVSITTDENNNKVRTFTNSLGQTLLKQVQMDESLEGVSTPWLETYFIYDTFGRLIYQVPPKAMKVLGTGASLNANSTAVNELIYKYTYDNKSRLLIKKEPGAVEQHFVYDKHDRLVFVQDGNLRAQNRWMFMKYDQYNRVVYSGVYSRNVTRATLQSEMDARNYDSEPYFDSEQVNATYHGYSNQVYPTTNLTVLTVNYYDHYDFDRNGAADYTYDNTHLAGQTSVALLSPRNLATGSKRVTINEAGAVTTNWLISSIFYDTYQRPVQSQSNNHLYLTVSDKSTIIYDFAGKPIQTKTTHCQSAGTCVTLIDRNEYDHAGRVLKMFRKINSDAEQQLVQMEYNALGQLVDKKLHVTGGSSLQSVDFRYTIQGQLKSINNAQLNSNPSNNDEANDFFGMEFIYNAVESGLANTQYYNGNISAIKWKGPGQASGNNDQRSYKYTYDKSDRLKTATFQAHDGIGWNRESNTLNESLTYDHNGNIKTLARNQNLRGLSGVTVTSTPQTIDNLTYTYASNRNVLTKVDDATGLATGFNNGVTTTTEYTYNTSGSLNADQNKGISSTVYNMLGKPQVVNFSNGKKIEYVYDAAGNKLSMKTYQGTTLLTTTNYSGTFVYEGTTPTLSYFGSPEGRVVKNGNAFEYQYAMADHQGNTRVVFTSATPTPVAVTATMEEPDNTNFQNYTNRVGFNLFDHTDAGTTFTYAQKLTGSYNAQVGLARTYKVYAGDKVKIEAWAKYQNPTSTGSNIAGFASALLAAFGVPAPAGGETGTVSSALNTWGSLVAGGSGGNNPSGPKAFVNIIVFDKNYKLLDAAWEAVDPAANQVGVTPVVAHDFLMREYTAKEEGYMFVYVSNENPTLVDVYFDDVVMTHTPGNVVQYNEYYPFGMQTANSWTRENVTGNNFLYNSGSELNNVSNTYETFFRGYDPVLGRMTAIDPMAGTYSSLSPYNYSFNDPVYWNDPNGADPMGYAWSLVDGIHSGQGLIVAHGGGGSGMPGSGYHWSDQFRSVTNNMMLMSINQFKNYYGVDLKTDAGSYWAANNIGTTAYWVTTDEGNFIYSDKSFQNLTGWYRAQAFTAQTGNGPSPWEVGWEWLTGTGPRHRDFTNGDQFTEMLRQHDHVDATRGIIKDRVLNGGKLSGVNPYTLGGVGGVAKYLKDYSTLLTGGTTGNLAVTYLGSYALNWQVTAVNGNLATVLFTVNNSSTIQSATRPPVIGYTEAWQGTIGAWLNSQLSSGPMSPTTQTFRWTETIRIK